MLCSMHRGFVFRCSFVYFSRMSDGLFLTTTSTTRGRKLRLNESQSDCWARDPLLLCFNMATMENPARPSHGNFNIILRLIFSVAEYEKNVIRYKLKHNENLDYINIMHIFNTSIFLALGHLICHCN